MKKKIVVITGPTASGKTSASISLAKEIDASIICADSRIVYRGLDIVSAKPATSEREGIKHYLIDILEPLSEFSAGDFVKYADEIINNTDKNIIISGGSWFYIKSLLDDYELIKSSSDKKLREELEKLNASELWEKLKSIDEKRANQIHPNNKEKVIRSIEMCLELKMPVSEYKRKPNKKYDAKWYMFDFERDVLYERINERVDLMIKVGLYDEWKKNSLLYPHSKILYNTIGYKEFFELEEGKYKTFDEAVDKIKQHTRNFAKRQLTYFKSNKEIKKIKDYKEILRDLKI